MSKHIGLYRELLPSFAKYGIDEPPLMTDSFSDCPIEHKDVIVDFLLNGGDWSLMTTSSAKDVFTGESTKVRACVLDDGEYSWGKPLAYYVDRYNLMLPEDFVAHILRKRGVH